MLRKRRLTPIVALIEAWGPLPDLGRWGQMNVLCVKMLLLDWGNPAKAAPSNVCKVIGQSGTTGVRSAASTH